MEEAERADEEADSKKAVAEQAAATAQTNDAPEQAAMEQLHRAMEDAETATKDAATEHLVWQDAAAKLHCMNVAAQDEQDTHRARVEATWFRQGGEAK